MHELSCKSADTKFVMTNIAIFVQVFLIVVSLKALIELQSVNAGDIWLLIF